MDWNHWNWNKPRQYANWIENVTSVSRRGSQAERETKCGDGGEKGDRLADTHSSDGIVSLRPTSLRFDLVPFGLFITKVVRFKRPADLDSPRCSWSNREASLAMAPAVKLDDRPVRDWLIDPLSQSKWRPSPPPFPASPSGSGVREMATPLMNNVGERGIPERGITFHTHTHTNIDPLILNKLIILLQLIDYPIQITVLNNRISINRMKYYWIIFKNVIPK